MARSTRGKFGRKIRRERCAHGQIGGTSKKMARSEIDVARGLGARNNFRPDIGRRDAQANQSFCTNRAITHEPACDLHIFLASTPLLDVLS